jgi:molybdopterin-guanine dinucleotide biosynthesis protein A
MLTLKSELTGIVVAGGKSLRMGTEKGLIPFGAKPLIIYPVAILKKVCAKVLISANSSSYDFLGLPVIADQMQGGGAMAGIYSALLASDTGYNLVLSCDMPMITENLVQYLIKSVRKCDATVAWHQGFAQPLCGIYKRSLVVELESHIREGKLKLLTFLKKMDTCYIEIDDRLPFYNANLFMNINTPEELVTGEKLIGS